MISTIKKAAGVLAAVPLLALGFSSAAGASTATVRPNATPACGTNCQDFSSYDLGPGTILNAYINGDTGGVLTHGGQLINMKFQSNERPNADFQVEAVGEVRNFCESIFNTNGFLPSTSVACKDYGSDEAYELDFSPWGNQSGYCAGTTGSPVPGLKFRLVACGTTQGSLLIQEAPAPADPAGYHAYISGATTSFSHPQVATVVEGSSNPGDQIQLEEQNTLTNGETPSSQLFTFKNGPV